MFVTRIIFVTNMEDGIIALQKGLVYCIEFGTHKTALVLFLYHFLLFGVDLK